MFRADSDEVPWRSLAGRVLLAVTLGGAALPAVAEEEIVTVDFGTNVASRWLITGAGVEDLAARAVTIYPGFISFSSNGTATGAFIPGASWSYFDGAWTADFSFALPRRAQNVYLDFYDLYADDRVVLSLNGSAIGNATMNGDVGLGQHTFAPGEAPQSFTFTQKTEDWLLKDPRFIVGDKDPRGSENVLRLSVNNNGTGGRLDLAQALPPSGFNGTVVRLRGLVSWTEDYQIRPYPNPSGNLVQVDDDPHGWYNAVWFDNDGGIVVAPGGTLTNRAGARLVNRGLVQNSGQLVMDGNYQGLAGSSFTNIGSMTVVGTMEESGTFINTGNLGTLSGASFTYTGKGRGSVFDNTGLIYNQGTFGLIGPGTQYSGSQTLARRFVNTGWLVLNGGATATESIANSGHIVVADGSVLLGHVENARFGDVQIAAGGVFSGSMNNAGTTVVQGDGHITTALGSVLLNDGGTLNVDAGGTLDVSSGGGLRNQGGTASLYVAAGGFLTVAPDAFLENLGGTIRIDGSADVLGALSNAGSVIGVSSGGQLRLHGDAQNTSTIIVGAASLLEIGPSGHLHAYAPGQIYLDPGSVLAVQGRLDDNTIVGDGARITGRGTIGPTATLNLVNSTIAPGNSPGTLSILGALTLDDASRIEVEIGSPDDYDRLVASGPVSFAPGVQVDVRFVDGYLPDAKDEFVWLSGPTGETAAGLVYIVPYSGWSPTSFTDDAGATRVTVESAEAFDLGPGGSDDRTIAAGQIAFVEAPLWGYGSEYANGGTLDNSGVIHVREGAQFTNYRPFSSYGTPGLLLNRAGAWFVNRGQFANDVDAVVNNAGTFYNHATGVLDNKGELTNAAGGRFVNRGTITSGGGAARIVNDGRFENRGTIVSTDVIENHGDFIIAASAEVRGTATQRGAYDQTAGRTQVDGLLEAETIFVTGGTIGGNGRLAGALVIDSGALLDPGDPLAAGRLALTGDLTLYGTLHVDIAGSALALHDVLDVDGIATVSNAILDVALLDGYRPALGDAFDLLWVSRGDSSTFAFLRSVLPALDPGLAWDTSYLVDDGRGTFRLLVSAAPVPLPPAFVLFGTALAGFGATLRILRRRS